MADWIPLNTRTHELPKRHKIRGVDITLVMSPYDIPDAVRGEYNKDLHRFVIEFRYISDEPWERSKYNDYIVLRIGRNSRRLYGIEVDVHALSGGESVYRNERIDVGMNVANAVKNAINEFARERGRAHRRRQNYEIAQDAIEEKQNQIFEGLTTA